MSKEKAGINFEQKLEILEALVLKMEGGNLKLEELLEEYAKGMELSKELMQELETAQGRLEILKGDSIKNLEDADEL